MWCPCCGDFVWGMRYEANLKSHSDPKGELTRRAFVASGVAAGASAAVPATGFGQSPTPTMNADEVVLANGRVIDPETKLDAVRNVKIKGGQIAAVSEAALDGQLVLDASGLVVAPGFIDWHVHAQSILADRVLAFDGVTTSLELEMGMLPLGRWYDIQAVTGRVLNYGAASSWAFARVATLEDISLPTEPRPEWAFGAFARKKWPNDVATPDQVNRIVQMIEQGLKEGGIGIGVVPGYAPGAGYMELLAVQTLAAKYEVPTYWHVRSEAEYDPLSAEQAYGEAISCAACTGSWLHICHLNSTSFHDIERAAQMVQSAQKQGVRITTEAYPYGAASTALGAAALAPENLPRTGMTYESIEYEGRRLNEQTYNELRLRNPGAIVVVHFLELPRDQALLDVSVLLGGAIIASDAMPWFSTKTGNHVDDHAWPPPDDAFSHPRSAGTHARFIGQYVRERRLISLLDAIAKTAYLPAKLMEETVPQLKKKGRIQTGMDADIVVFDPLTVQDRATYERPNQVSVGMKHVLVNGKFVIHDGVLDTNAFPGQAVRRAA
jgi:N-acyl-D-glutamate deacylase